MGRIVNYASLRVHICNAANPTAPFFDCIPGRRRSSVAAAGCTGWPLVLGMNSSLTPWLPRLRFWCHSPGGGAETIALAPPYDGIIVRQRVLQLRMLAQTPER